jgi:hypothetical protein
MRDDVSKTEELLFEMLMLALRGVGPENAAELAKRIDLASWDLPVDWERVRTDALPRRERRERLSTLARDLESALGRWSGDLVPMDDLFAKAGITPQSAEIAGSAASNTSRPEAV